jgi:CDP-paratose 2-epimerase
MRILITGGCGFVGSNLAVYFKRKYNDVQIYCFDNLMRRGSEINLVRLQKEGITFIHGDIRNKSDFNKIPAVDIVIDAAAEPSVMAGLDGSTDYLIDTNFNGTINCLNFATANKAIFIFLSTSRIYPIGTLENANFVEEESRFVFTKNQTVSGLSEKGVSEQLSLKGVRSLYGATKLASEYMITEYIDAFGLKAVINRCGVITGPYQMGKVDQGVVVLWAARHFWQTPLSYIGYGGEGKQVRDVLHIHDLFRLVDWQINNIDIVNGEILNVGGGNETSLSLQELTAICEDISGNKIDIKKVLENRPSDLRIYITDNTKVFNMTEWKPLIKREQIMVEIFQWIRNNEKDLKSILN